MRKALFLLLFLVGGVAFVLVAGNKAASASTLPLLEQEQSGTNHNQTSQDADADATTRQANVNLPISISSFGANDGNVSQGNRADTSSSAKNNNDTNQGIDQGQHANVAGSRGTSPDGRSGLIDQAQSAANDNRTDQDATSSATTRQLNVNAPVSVLSWGSNNGDVRQHNDGTTAATARNDNGTDQSVAQDQRARSQSSGSKWSGGGGGVAQSQDAKNGNETNQSSDADASTKQVNVNAPVSVLSFGANNGNVDQANSADTSATAKNSNRTDQQVDQDQSATVDAPSRPAHGHDGYSHPPKPCGCGHDGYSHPPKPQPAPCGCGDHGSNDWPKPKPKPEPERPAPSIVQHQQGANDNSTTQDATADATTQQKNLNVPFSFAAWGGDKHQPQACGCPSTGHGPWAAGPPSVGGVRQHNQGTTNARAGNNNQTRQTIGQLQEALIGRR